MNYDSARRLARWASPGLLGLALAFPASAQEKERVHLPGIDRKEHTTNEEYFQEIEELFGSIETRLEEIDDMLYDASGGESASKSLAELISSSTSAKEENLADIDRLLELNREGAPEPSPGGS